jgi:hypothetical protein
LEFLVVFQLQNITDPKAKLEAIIYLLTHELPESAGILDYNKNFLNQIVISESSKVYLVKDIVEINKSEVFKPFKDLCATIAKVISEFDTKYLYPRSLSSTLIETAHNLPRLTDAKPEAQKEFTGMFLMDLLFKVLGK